MPAISTSGRHSLADKDADCIAYLVEENRVLREQITGVRIPHWDSMTKKLLDVCAEMSYIPYVGWDIIITPDGFAVIEGNNYPDLGHQVFSPLLEDPRVRAFYEKFDAL